MRIYIRPFALGALTFLPGFKRLLALRAGGSTSSATYCYSVWLKHMVMLWQSGMRAMPRSMAELGPGDSLGVGLAAMLCGVDEYYALDVMEYANVERNLNLLNELVELFRQRAPRPDKGWPDYDPYLDTRLFPSHILTDAVLDAALAPDRIARIRDAIRGVKSDNARSLAIKYIVPWNEEASIQKNSVDLVISHAVLQSVVDLPGTYAALYSWLKPAGFMSHQIDYTSFRTSRSWNGHWAYSEKVWKIIVGARSFLINREPHSTHVNLMSENGFALTIEMKRYIRGGGIPRSRLAPRWSYLSDEDLQCSGAFVQARKPQTNTASNRPQN